MYVLGQRYFCWIVLELYIYVSIYKEPLIVVNVDSDELVEK